MDITIRLAILDQAVKVALASSKDWEEVFRAMIKAFKDEK
ncbi:hypothetical protein LCGC14_2553540 [marine sediment metagenome]|uniref:Uncharacterized protein n=1 Tax=marine sediment metagenome TaxID=412755 RepID=A0A0F9AM43_9ZZZZ